MKILFTLILCCSSAFLFGQTNILKNLWYVEKSVKNEQGKMTITLTCDSVSMKVKDNTCIEMYNFKTDSTYYKTSYCNPTDPKMRELQPGYGLYSEGIWTIDAMSNLKLVSTVKTKKYISEYLVSWISDRKILLTEK